MAWAAVALLAASTLLMWLPALRTPFWGDDYVFLLQAHAAHLSAAPWWSEFWPQTPVRFWRPLSQGGYWRAMLACFGSSALAMHVASLCLHLLASTCVGLFAWSLAGACRWQHPRMKAALAGALYATLSIHFLPVEWAAAANNSMLTVFTALALSAWMVATRVTGTKRLAALAVIPILQILALLTKESAVLIPLLLIVTSLFARRWSWRKGNLATLAVCIALIGLWLVLDARFTANVDSSYTLEVGFNVIRNAAAFIAWLLNVPREALRMVFSGNIGIALAWAAVTAVPMLAAWLVALWRGHRQLSLFQWAAVIVFALLAYGPYFLFSWNSYPYYAAIAVILPIIVLARLTGNATRTWAIVVLIAVSSWLAVAGSRHAGQPALIARAQWGNRLLTQLAKEPVKAPLWVQVSNKHRFYAVGRAGLAWRLDLDPGAIHLATHCPASARHCLVIDKSGQWHWRSPSTTGHAMAATGAKGT